MLNIRFRQVPIPQDPSKMSIHLAWRVPIDDENMLSYMVNRVPPFDDDMRMKMESSADYDELTRRLMNCEMTLEEVDPGHGLLPVIQDTVSIGGPGAIAEPIGRASCRERVGQDV